MIHRERDNYEMVNSQVTDWQTSVLRINGNIIYKNNNNKNIVNRLWAFGFKKRNINKKNRAE